MYIRFVSLKVSLMNNLDRERSEEGLLCTLRFKYNAINPCGVRKQVKKTFIPAPSFSNFWEGPDILLI